MITRRTFQAGLLASAAGLGACKVDAAPVAGTWSGLLEAGSQRLRVRLDIQGDGAVGLLVPDDTPQSVPGRINSLTSRRIEMDFAAIEATFSGRFTAADRIEGLWRQNGSDIAFVVSRGEAGLRPPPPLRPMTRERLAELRAVAGSPALAAGAMRRRGPLRMWVDGERAVGTRIAAQENDRWHLGSITKSMTATLVARLADTGAVRWDDTVGDILREVAPEMRDAYRAATFRHLLSHRSGLPGTPTRLTTETVDPREARRAAVRTALASAPKGPMGTTFDYANDGYVVVGAMLETKLGMTWEDLIRAHVFEPLQLSTAGFGAPGRRDATDQPLGHSRGPFSFFSERRVARPVGSADLPVALWPAGAVHMSLPDLLRYLAVHRDRSSFLRPETWAILHTPPFGGRDAMGWMLRGAGILMHGGTNSLWYAEVLFDAETGVIAAAASNDGYTAKSSLAVGRALIEAAAAA